MQTPDGPFPFRLWIHAGQSIQWRTGPDAIDSTLARAWSEWGKVKVTLGYTPTATTPRTGVLLGSGQVDGCHDIGHCERTPGGCSPWAQYEPGIYHWQVSDPQPLDTPILMRGRQRLWRLTTDDLAGAA
jgi:hypothetical protein